VTVSYAIVSYAMRRDLHDPLRFFEVLRPIHFFQTASYRDMTSTELEGTYHFHNPADLLLKLRKARPQIVQGGEPFVRRLVPVALACLAYAKSSRRPLVVPSLENLPISGKYGAAWAAAMRAAVTPYVRGATLAIAANAGAEVNLRWAGARPVNLVRMMYGSWGVDTAEFSPSARMVEHPTIVFLGRLEHEKGVFDLVEAMPKVLATVDARLVMIGDGPDAAALKQAVQDAGLTGRVRFEGAVKNKDVPGYLRAATVLAAPSRTTKHWAEQVGMSAIQAMACGVPVVSTPSGSIAEFIDDGVTGLLVPQGDPPALANALTKFLTDIAMRETFAQRAREQAVIRFDACTNIRAVERRILEACGYSG
jgi:glycosyltransferase involved in cell wall biosynthesis